MAVKKGGKKTNEPLFKKMLSEQENREKKVSKWLYIGLFTMVILIVSIWGYATFYSLSALSFQKTEEGRLIDKTKTDWQKTFKKRNEAIERQATFNEIKNLITSLETSTTTDNTTTTVTSTIITTSTNS